MSSISIKLLLLLLFTVIVKVNANDLFIVEVHLDIKLVQRHSTFNHLKETIQT